MTRRITVAFAFGLLGSYAAAQQYVISTFAGGAGAAPMQLQGDVNLQLPIAVTADATGVVYFSSAKLHSVFKLETNGTITRVAGNGLGQPGYSRDGGSATSATLSLDLVGAASPGGLAVDRAGDLFIADSANNRIRRVSPTGVITTVAGTGEYGLSGDGGSAINAKLGLPTGIALDNNGNLFFAERGNNLVRRISPDGIITTVAGGGAPSYNPTLLHGSAGQAVGDGGPATKAILAGPAGIALDAEGSLFIADSFNNRIRKVSSDGFIATVAGNGAGGLSGDGGSALDAQINFPIGVAVDDKGNLFVGQFVGVREVAANGTITTIAGGKSSGFSGDGGPATSASFANAFAIARDSTGNLYIADTANNRIRKISPEGIIVTAAGGEKAAPTGDGGPAGSAEITEPLAVASDSRGNVFIADNGNNRIRMVSANGIITTVAGTGTRGFSGDGEPAISAQLSYPTALAVDGVGNLFVGDAARVRKVAVGGIITTVAGNGTTGFPQGLGDGGPATSATLGGFVGGLVVDQAGNLFISDSINNRVRKVSADGIIHTVAGGGIITGDGGPATSARLGVPRGLVVAGGGDLLVAEQGGRVRKVTPDGIISTVAGNGAFFGPSGDGGPAISARLSAPTGLALDSLGNLFIADPGLYFVTGGEVDAGCACDHQIRRVSPDGIITTLAGSGVPGFSGNGGPASTAVLNGPVGVAVDPTGNVYVADFGNSAVRVLRPTGRSLLIGAVVDAASPFAGTISPGKIVVIYGAGLGPDHLVQNQAKNGAFGIELSGTTIAFDGVAAPILYTSATQVGAVVPYEIASAMAQVAVTYQGQTSNAVTVSLRPSAPSLFTLNQQGWGQAAAINAAFGSVNTAGNPLKVGDYVSLFATGEGQTFPAGVDGKIAGSTPPHPVLPVSVTIGGIPATEVQYAGSIAGQVAGLMQVNVRIPDGVQPGGYVPVVLRVGDTSSLDSVWIAVSKD
jgi:uncharacterized protein (TIGR03437 family)